jgi:Na+/serine symporter
MNTRTKPRNLLGSLLLLAVIATLSACSGGGGGGGAVQDVEIQNNWNEMDWNTGAWN